MIHRFAIGDIHGCFLTLKKLLKEKICIQKEDELYFVGDYIDRGPSSKDVLDYLIYLKSKGFNIYPIRGNHEDLLLEAYNNPFSLQTWLRNGAEESLKSFQIPENILLKPQGVKMIPEKYIEFLKNLPYFYELDDAIIVHAGLNFEIEYPLEDKESMLWIREFQYNGTKIANKKLIHGHTPTPIKNLHENLSIPHSKVINIDTGCVYNSGKGLGYLSAINIDNNLMYSQKNIDHLR